MEMPVSQIQAYKWDKIPEVAKYRPDTVMTRINCELGCVNRDFNTEDDYKDHISGWHSESKSTIAIGQELGKVMKQLPQTQASDPVAIGAAVSAAIAQMMPSLLQVMREGNAAQPAAPANPRVRTIPGNAVEEKLE